MSNGVLVNKKVIDQHVRKAKGYKLDMQKDMYGYNFCEDCHRNAFGTRLDCSHDISVDKCQKNGCAELAWDVDNITIRCRPCHQLWDKSGLISTKSKATHG